MIGQNLMKSGQNYTFLGVFQTAHFYFSKIKPNSVPLSISPPSTLFGQLRLYLYLCLLSPIPLILKNFDMKIKIFFFLVLSIFLKQKNQAQIFSDSVWTKTVRTPLLYPKVTGTVQDMLRPPVVPLNPNEPTSALVLEFDWYEAEPQTFRAKVLHCNADWQPSVLTDIEYLSEYNDFPLLDYQLSFGIKTSYLHFVFAVPTVKLSGNYVLWVYPEGQPERPMLTRRFMVYETQVAVGGRVDYASYNDRRRTHQQLDFSVHYRGVDVINPAQDLRVVLRQNYRFDRQLSGFKPFLVREAERRLDYTFFEEENLFEGGNEFHVVDLRSTQMRLFGVTKIAQLPRMTEMWAYADEVQAGKAYVQRNDFDGQFVIDNYETNRGATEADYVRVHLSLLSAELEGQAVFVTGAFNFWALTPENQMHYNPTTQRYEGEMVLKQGIYNYRFVTQETSTLRRDEAAIEGSHAATQNDYEVLVYARPVGARADALVGYQVISFQRR
jgi:Domain of unknown function (DUF5103)